MSEHAIEMVNDHGELRLRFTCSAVKGSPCRVRPADPDVEEWSDDYEGEMVDAGSCWATQWVDAGGFDEAIRPKSDGLWVSVPVSISYDECVEVDLVSGHTELVVPNV